MIECSLGRLTVQIRIGRWDKVGAEGIVLALPSPFASYDRMTFGPNSPFARLLGQHVQVADGPPHLPWGRIDPYPVFRLADSFPSEWLEGGRTSFPVSLAGSDALIRAAAFIRPKERGAYPPWSAESDHRDGATVLALADAVRYLSVEKGCTSIGIEGADPTRVHALYVMRALRLFALTFSEQEVTVVLYRPAWNEAVSLAKSLYHLFVCRPEYTRTHRVW
jgi:hypothetical protein